MTLHRLILPAVIVALSFCASTVLSQEIWDGGHSSSNYWFANINWLDDTAPVDGSDLIFTGATRLSHNSWADLGGGDNDFDINSITFNAVAGAFVINNGGGPAGSIIKLQGDIANDSTNLQTMNFHFQLTGGNRAVNTNAGDITLGGVISEDGSARRLFQTGTNTLTLTGANTHTNGVQIGITNGSTAGTVSIENNTALGIGSLEFGAGGTLDLAANGLTVGNSVFVANRVDTVARTIQLDLAGSNTGELTGQIDIRQSTSGGFVADVGTADTLTFSGNLVTGAGGGAGITKKGDGTLVLSGANTYSGTTTVKAGTLVVNGDNSNAFGMVMVDFGAEFGGSGTIGGATTINGTHTVGSDPTTLSVDTQTFGSDLTYGDMANIIWELESNADDSTGMRGTNFDGIDVTGDLTFTGTTTMDFSFNGGTVDANAAFWNTAGVTRSWTIFSGANSIAGAIDGSLVFNENSFATPTGGSFFFTEDTGTGSVVLNYTFSAVPEPTALLLFGFGVSMIGFRRRRVRRHFPMSMRMVN